MTPVEVIEKILFHGGHLSIRDQELHIEAPIYYLYHAEKLCAKHKPELLDILHLTFTIVQTDNPKSITYVTSIENYSKLRYYGVYPQEIWPVGIIKSE